ncbi:hypothetical protein ID866_3121 [Astraeus odoratus]|nr:hypothetical protein ID866_3121 [Astraeus odoratus]
MKQVFLNTDKSRGLLEQEYPSKKATTSTNAIGSSSAQPQPPSSGPESDAKADPASVANPKSLPSTSETTEKKPTSPPKQPGDPLMHFDTGCSITSSTDLHQLPPQAAKQYGGKRRVVFRAWPRDPNGKPIIPDARVRGKEAPNGILNWGATLYDFFQVRPIPNVRNAISTASGSRIAAAMRALGELDYAADELAWADEEPDPCQLSVADTEELVECYEFRMGLAKVARFSAVDEVRAIGLMKYRELLREEGSNYESSDSEEEPPEDMGTPPSDEKDSDAIAVGNDEGDTEMSAVGEGMHMDIDTPVPHEGASPGAEPDPPVDEKELVNGIAHVLMSDRPLSSPFHPSHYSPPWPFIPFENLYPPVLLQKRILLHLLPETLFVHDPYDLLRVRFDALYDPTTWLKKPPRVHKYKLRLTSSSRDVIREARKQAEEQEIVKKRTLNIYRFLPSEEERARGEPTYEVPLPTRPPDLTRVDEAHLYISPVAKLGIGHHSVVYKAEWELPRNLLVKPKLCDSCIYEELQKELCKLKKSGKWKAMLRAAGWQPPEECEDESPSGEEDYEMPVPPDPNEEFDQERIYLVQTRTRHPSGDDNTPTSADKMGIVFRIYCPNIKWYDPLDPQTQCRHFSAGSRSGPAPRTAMVQVAAKLSFPYDTHLDQEARNYQSFPDHFFQHWSGYNIVRPLHNPVPVRAIVPQFYGYYVPDENNSKDVKSYLSPILLLEHCGTRLNTETLTMDEREECASLLLRFNDGGWLHESVFDRNLLVQQGLPTEWPIDREVSENRSFRLIDFGRSKPLDRNTDLKETDEAMRLFQLLHGVFLQD